MIVMTSIYIYLSGKLVLKKGGGGNGQYSADLKR